MTGVTDKDKGWNDIKRNMRQMNGSYVKVGLQSGSVHKGREGHLSDLVAIGAIHEYGTKNVPERSFMRTTFDEQKPQLTLLKKRLVSSITSRRINTEQGLRILGEFMASAIKKKITDIQYPPLKNPSKKRAKGGIPNPLVDTGQLRAGVTPVVVIK